MERIGSTKSPVPGNGTIFMRKDEVARVLEVSESYAYKLIHRLNAELKKQGCITIPGRIDRKFFYEHFYGTREDIDLGKKGSA